MNEKLHDPDLDEDLVPEDDAVIGRAFRISMFAILALVAVALAVVAALRSGGEEEEVVLEKEVGHIADLVPDAAAVPEVRFTDITQQAGIEFVHHNGARGEKLLPETMGGGAAFFDYDGDGDQDVFLVNGSGWKGVSDGALTPGNALYRNDGSGHFQDVTAGSGLEGEFYGMGTAVGDYDGDGRVDVFVTAVGTNHLYRNTPEGFVETTEKAGVAGDPEQWTTSAGFFDADGDRDLDLFVCHYVKWSRAIDEKVAFTMNGVDRAYGPPTNFEGTFSTLYRNDGDGTFTDVSEAAGIQVKNAVTGAPMGKALGVSFMDVDGDGDQDVFVANDTVQNHLFLNRGDGTFDEVGADVGIGYDGNGRATGAMGIDVGDYCNDGRLAFCIGNFANEMSSFYVMRPGALRFSDDSIGEGIGAPSRQVLSFGMFFFDYDLDGRLDVLQVNGHLEETIHEVQPSQHYLQAPQLFWNAGTARRSCYLEVPSETTGDLATRVAGRGSCYADVDGDGDQDVLILQVGSRPLLLRNDQHLGHEWLRVKLVGLAPNRDALGAVVSVRANGTTMRRNVTPTRSYLSQSELPLTFGLGADPVLESIEIRWPDGRTQSVPPPQTLERTLVVHRQE